MPSGSLSEQLSSADRLNLINMVCSFAWSDFELSEEERDHIRSLCRRLELDAAGRAQVESWLAQPPDTESLADPGSVPVEARDAFLKECQRVILADGYVDAEESMSYRIFREILSADGRSDD
jgi:uncharacterized tellurite resistance protein B-like protein